MTWNGCDPFPMQVTVTRDDLIRLVVGMQMAEMVLLARAVDAAFCALGHSGAEVTIEVDDYMAAEIRPASTIVDEWLGVRS